jgi:hypothetical protein
VIASAFSVQVIADQNESEGPHVLAQRADQSILIDTGRIRDEWLTHLRVQRAKTLLSEGPRLVERSRARAAGCARFE